MQGGAQTEQEVDEQVGRHLAAQLRELLATQPLELSLARILPGILLILRRGTRYIGTTGATSALSVLLESSWSSLLVQELSVGARVDAIPAFLDAILLSQTGAAHVDDATSEAFFERFKPKSTRGLCGYLFQRNDIAFNCRTCQLDETCVLCLKCYQNGNHDGHDIYFHRTQPGGMCDCGDAEAWDPDGFCIYHDLALRDALVLMQELKSEGWHVCVVYDQHIRDEEVLIKLISWIKLICTLSKPMQNLFCTKLFTTTNALAAPKEPIQVMFLSDPYFRKEIVLVLYELYLKLQSDKDPKLQFSLVFLKVYSRLMNNLSSVV
ncbi:hypothetical protein ATCC90586_002916 [Pythium insidiosum]|nr:hypothetical protein ATCC90586_002916 [Pythium insidiosum]